jgi:hypothetical protein
MLCLVFMSDGGKNSNTMANTALLDLGHVRGITWGPHLIEWLAMAESVHMYNYPQAMYGLISSTTLTLVQTSRAANALLEEICVLWSHSPLIQIKLFTLFHNSVKEYVCLKQGKNVTFWCKGMPMCMAWLPQHRFLCSYIYIYICYRACLIGYLKLEGAMGCTRKWMWKK